MQRERKTMTAYAEAAGRRRAEEILGHRVSPSEYSYLNSHLDMLCIDYDPEEARPLFRAILDQRKKEIA